MPTSPKPSPTTTASRLATSRSPAPSSCWAAAMRPRRRLPGKAGREPDQPAILEPFEKHYGDDWWYRTQLAFAQIELGQFAEGQRNIDNALAAYPKSAHAAHIRGHLFYETGEREAGLAFLKEWMADYPRDGMMHCHNHWHLALWSMETGRHAEAWRIYDDALRPGA